jgi:hypothetical protein
MIPVTRGEPLENFAVRAKDWNERFATAKEADAELTASKFWSRVRPELRADAAVLAERFHYKCAYCESMLPHVAHPHIEHYSFRPCRFWRLFSRRNLLTGLERLPYTRLPQ